MEKTRTTPLHPQSDGMVVRFNRTILNHLALFVSRNQRLGPEVAVVPSGIPESNSREYRLHSITDRVWARVELPCDLLFERSPDAPCSPE
ncbi:hypothetical protein HNY73_009880 [Argiope bruennichi]|uniref:Integrase catalytic domain-containing protein n=1 Tax=Argiope bruennichi TaxID=94029 RepID=A0A8T0FAT6_ARGBR|nr:hypothetical protein HNY73_009880 [Argiope bruennichi]